MLFHYGIDAPGRRRPRQHCRLVLWCNHVYVEYTPEIEGRHFAYDCPGAPEKLKQTALASLAKRRAGK